MKKLKLNPVVLDTLSNEQLQKIIGGNGDDTNTDSEVKTETECVLCEITVTTGGRTTPKP